MDKVLVTKAIRPNYNTLGGGPVMVVGGNQGRGSQGRTRLQRLGGGLGGLVGVAGALTGQHRSLGSLANAMVSGGAQGSTLGGSLGRRLSSRESRARADMDEATRNLYAQYGARGDLDRFQFRQRRPQDMRQQIGVIDAEKARQAQEERMARQAQRAENRARARARGREFGEEDLNMANRGRAFTNMFTNYGASEEEITQAQRAAAGMQPINAQGQPVDPMLQLPPPMGAGDTAAAEIQRDENAGNKEAVGQGMDNERSKSAGVKNLREIQEAEFKENEAETQENSNRVGVVNPNSLRDIQSRQQQGV